MHFTRARDLVVAGVIAMVLAFVLFQAAYGSVPALPAAAGVTLLVLAVVEVVLAGSLRGRIRAGRVEAAITVARAVALAKASSIGGAFILGGWIGVLAYLLTTGSRLAAASADLPAAAIGVVCAAALVAAALWLEHCCRTPRPPEEDRER